MTNFEKILMERDGLTLTEANKELTYIKKNIAYVVSPEKFMFDKYNLPWAKGKILTIKVS